MRLTLEQEIGLMRATRALAAVTQLISPEKGEANLGLVKRDDLALLLELIVVELEQIAPKPEA
jgi:hypothetical protein